MWVTKHKKILFSITALYVLASIVFIVLFGLRPSIEFTGGTLIEVQPAGETALTQEAVRTAVNGALSESYTLQSFGDEGYTIRTRFLDEAGQSSLLNALTATSTGARVERVSSIGPTIGSELKSKAVMAIVVVSLLIILFIAFAFRKVSKPISSWVYGIVAIITLLHDVIVPTGVFAILGHYFGYEVDVLFVMALLAILGYSVNDTIVVFDRIRENLRINQDEKKDEPFSDIVGRSLKQTFARSLNTSLTTILVLLALYIFGAQSTEHFALTLLVGALAGTYSSLFLASPLLVQIEEWQRKRREANPMAERKKK